MDAQVAPVAKPGMGLGKKIAIGCGVLILAFVLFIGGLLGVVWWATAGPEEAVRAFLAAAAAGDYEKAHDYFAVPLKEKQPLEEFRAGAERTPSLFAITDSSFNNRSIDETGANVAEAGPSIPVEILGFDSAPEAGDQFAVVENEGRAREITDYRVRKRRDTMGSAGTPRTLEQMMQSLKETGRKDFTLLVKGDVQGSVEAIAGALRKLGTDEVAAQIVHSGVGGITESDVALASASKAVIVGFNVRANAQAKAHAERDGIQIRYYSIIYDLVDDVKAAMSGLLAPTIREIYLGKDFNL